MLRLGLYGGSFDPIHHGHLILARQALEDLTLDRVIFIPAAESPFKLDHSGASAADRLAMAQLAIEGEPAFLVDPLEIDRPPPSYTIDTARAYRSQHPGDALFFLVGEDHLAALPKWNEFSELDQLVQFAILSRSDLPLRVSTRWSGGGSICRRLKSETGLPMICQSRIWFRRTSCVISRRENFTGERCIGADELARLCVRLAEDKKAEDIVVLDLRGISSFTDFFVICSGTSEPHLKGINSGIRAGIREYANISPLASEGSVASQWLVMDYSGVLVHIFLQKKREFYALESLWSDAPRLNLVS